MCRACFFYSRNDLQKDLSVTKKHPANCRIVCEMLNSAVQDYLLDTSSWKRLALFTCTLCIAWSYPIILDGPELLTNTLEEEIAFLFNSNLDGCWHWRSKTQTRITCVSLSKGQDSSTPAQSKTKCFRNFWHVEWPNKGIKVVSELHR